MYTALLDACVLVPTTLGDLLLRIAERGYYRPIWSTQILEEVKIAVLRVHPEVKEAQIDSRVSSMNHCFEDALTTGWEDVCAGLDLPDENDRHVFAAAIAGGAQAIVTFNLKDFPEQTLKVRDIQPTHPDHFLLDQLDLAPAIMLSILKAQVADMKRPATDLAALLNRLERIGVPEFASEMRRIAFDQL